MCDMCGMTCESDSVAIAIPKRHNLRLGVTIFLKDKVISP